ncbi:phosphatase PAP2 family protein [Helicobacter sp. 11S02629-2]|uniref:phosphatase PAP2 family protein n=1 Tax=Helicobacter sp. 11S02629-2 TaxID=1476195 RepID=UPI000BA6C376|nr:phosphatase PAP2 family protein [Helicobacter sp. 11S02629-2]PAF43669.1 hypothetical protein BKH40_06610 [Helicobacter sp. 11S02629-2]
MRENLALVLSFIVTFAIIIFGSFRLYGDVFQYMPLYVFIFLLWIRAYRPAIGLVFATAIAFLIMRTIKNFFGIVSLYNPNMAEISRRPDVLSDYDGFPSGHSTGSFIGAGFATALYGYKVGFLVSVVCALVCCSRLYVNRHTLTQVLVGALLGFLVGFYIGKLYSKKVIALEPS